MSGRVWRTLLQPVPMLWGLLIGVWYYSPDFNPLENAFSKLKALLRKAAERTVEGLWTAIGRLIDAFTPAEGTHYFAAAGYDAM